MVVRLIGGGRNRQCRAIFAGSMNELCKQFKPLPQPQSSWGGGPQAQIYLICSSDEARKTVAKWLCGQLASRAAISDAQRALLLPPPDGDEENEQYHCVKLGTDIYAGVSVFWGADGLDPPWVQIGCPVGHFEPIREQLYWAEGFTCDAARDIWRECIRILTGLRRDRSVLGVILEEETLRMRRTAIRQSGLYMYASIARDLGYASVACDDDSFVFVPWSRV